MSEQEAETFNAAALADFQLTKIRGFRIHNEGIFLCKGYVRFRPGNIRTYAFPSDFIHSSQSVYRDLRNINSEKGKIPANTAVNLHIDIVRGDDCRTEFWYQYDENSKFYIEFIISGTAWDSDVSPPSVRCFLIEADAA